VQLKEANAQTILNVVREPVLSRITRLQNREDTIVCEGGKSIAMHSKINYLTKINYRVRAHLRRPRNDVGYTRSTGELVELSRVKSFND
jgi:hypothetical protein